MQALTHISSKIQWGLKCWVCTATQKEPHFPVFWLRDSLTMCSALPSNRAELQLAYSPSKAVTILPCRPKANTSGRETCLDLLLLLTHSCSSTFKEHFKHQATVAVFNPAGKHGSSQGTHTRFQGAFIASSVCGLYCLQSARVRTFFPACCADVLPQHDATESSGFPSILL